jgi:hypothetical protein
LKTAATCRLRGLCLLLPLPWANTTDPVAWAGMVRLPARLTDLALTLTSLSMRTSLSTGRPEDTVPRQAKHHGTLASQVPQPHGQLAARAGTASENHHRTS